MRPPSEARARKFARDLRKALTETEKALWQELRRGKIPGTRFRRQVPIGPYVADFACLQCKLIIELGGSQHVDQATYDDERTKFLEAQNFRVLRFWNGTVSEEREAVIEAIVWAVTHPDWRQHRDPLPNPPSAGEGEEY
jgi:very-short-patch-repair endonuclease